MPLSKARNRERMRQFRLHAPKRVELVQPNIPLYNPMKHGVGDRVLVQRGKHLVDIVIPELDADGQPIYE